MSALTSLLERILSSRARSVLRILPRSGQDSLKMPVPTLLGGATGQVALDDVQLALVGVALGAICQFARQGEAFQGALADDEVPRFAGRFAGASRSQAFFSDGARRSRILFQEGSEGLAQHLLNLGLHLRVHQLDFGLALKLRVAVLHAHNRRQALPCVVAREVGVGVLE